MTGSWQTTARRVEAWFAQNARDLPWRRVRDPYHTLLVEFILQQTRIETGLRYYERFMTRYPTIRSLAAAEESEVLSLWSGLGYYRRARNLHRAARTIVQEHEGRVPDDPEVLRTLPGVGPYTAGAVASIAYDRPVPSIDGNQARVIGRVLGMRSTDGAPARARLEAWARSLLEAGSPRTLNQALMDIGSLLCLPSAPRCGACPLADDCRSRGRVAKAPRARRVRPVEHWTARLHVKGDRVWLTAPREEGLLAHLWLPPLERTALSFPGPDMVHAFSHKTWHVRFVRSRARPSGPGRWVTRADLTSLPHARLTARAVVHALEAPRGGRRTPGPQATASRPARA